MGSTIFSKRTILLRLLETYWCQRTPTASQLYSAQAGTLARRQCRSLQSLRERRGGLVYLVTARSLDFSTRLSDRLQALLGTARLAQGQISLCLKCSYVASRRRSSRSRAIST
jgi:hypothetical protein